uniref:Vacuolar protein sorting-associated protein 51 homolog n=1 Tax=Meloidogyne incognita TaxID=6306 RepID=A0A914MDI1_MELIC
MSFSTSSKSTLDINSSNFDPEYYVQDLLRKKGLEELVAVEQDMVNNVRRLDSEMQSLVYENYSKFLNATSTVKDMQNRLTDAHNEMNSLSSRMNKITDLSDSLTEKFAKNCERVKKLNEARDSVKRLEFLIKAPQILQTCVEQNDFSKAVNTFVSIQPKLEKLKNLPSMAGIASDSEKIMEGVKKQLSEQLERRLISSESVIQAVQLLKKLGISENELESQLLSTFEREIYSELNKLREEENEQQQQIPGELPTNIKFNDIFEFVDTGCCHFLTNVSLMASTFLQLFNKQHSRAEFAHLLERVMTIFEQIVDKRFANETNSVDCSLFVKSLDRICRKISVLARLSPDFSFTRMNSSIVHRAAKHQIILCRQFVDETIQKAINEAFTKLNNSTPIAFSSSHSDKGQFYSSGANNNNNARKTLLRELLDKIEHCVLHSIKSALASLLMFTATDIIFSSIPHFTAIFGFDVHEQIVIGSIQDLTTNINLRIDSLTENEEEGKGTELLIFCALLRNLRLKHLEYLLELAQQQYRLNDFHFSNQYKLSNIETPTSQLQQLIEKLLRKYIHVESLSLSKIANKYIFTFEWAECSETPQRVRTLIKHLVRSVAEKDVDVAALLENDGFTASKERTPESSYGYYTMRRAASVASSVYNNNNNNDNNSSLGGSSGGIVERLWGDDDNDDTDGEENNKNGEGAIKEFLANLKVEFRRDVVMNALIRLLSLYLCEFVRAQPKFSRNGLEQLQVDCAYMRQKLWAHAGDEHMLNMSIEDVVTAAVNQCAQPKLLDPFCCKNYM